MVQVRGAGRDVRHPMSSSWSTLGAGGEEVVPLGPVKARGWPSGLLVGVIMREAATPTSQSREEAGASASLPFLSHSPLPSAKPRPRQRQLEGAWKVQPLGLLGAERGGE